MPSACNTPGYAEALHAARFWAAPSCADPVTMDIAMRDAALMAKALLALHSESGRIEELERLLARRDSEIAALIESKDWGIAEIERLKRETVAPSAELPINAGAGLAKPETCHQPAGRDTGGSPAAPLGSCAPSASAAFMPPSKYRDLIIESCAQRIETHDVYTTAAAYFAKFLRDTKGNATDSGTSK